MIFCRSYGRSINFFLKVHPIGNALLAIYDKKYDFLVL